MNSPNRKLATVLVSGVLLMVFVGIAMASTFQVSGTVTNQSSVPLSGAAVEAINPGDGSVVAVTTTDSLGYYALSVAGGTFHVRVTPPAGSAFQVSIALNRVIGVDTVLDFVLVPSGVAGLSGRIQDRYGSGVSGLQLYLTASGGGSQINVATDNTGVYEYQVAPGDFVLQIQGSDGAGAFNAPRNFYLQTEVFTLSASTIADITIPAHRVSVHVQDPAGNPVANTAVNCSSQYAPGLSIGPYTGYGYSQYPTYLPAAVTDGSGDAVMWLFPNDAGNPTGKYTLTATPAPGGSLATTNVSGVKIQSDMSVTITLATPVTLSGRIQDRYGSGVSGLQLYLTASGGGSQINVATDNTGVYEYQVAPGDFVLQIQGSDGAGAFNAPRNFYLQTEVFTLSASTIADITIPAHRVSVHVQDPAGNPVANTAVNCSSQYAPGLSIGPYTGYGYSQYPTYLPAAVTDGSGDAVMWLFPNDAGNPTSAYTLTATPAPDSPFVTFNVVNSISSDKEIVIVLQFVHDPPVSTVALSPSPNASGEYSNPTTVTLSATAFSGFTVAETYYSVDAGSNQTYTARFTVSGAGPHTIRYWSVDNSGVFEIPNSRTFTINAQQLTELGPAGIWLGLKNSDDVGTKFDLLAEVLKNGAVVGSGQLDNVPGGSSGFNNAVLRTIDLALSSTVSCGVGDTLSIRLSVRIAVGVPGHRSGTARLWFNDAAASSRFSATIGGIASDYFLLDGFALGPAARAGTEEDCRRLCRPFGGRKPVQAVRDVEQNVLKRQPVARVGDRRRSPPQVCHRLTNGALVEILKRVCRTAFAPRSWNRVSRLTATRQNPLNRAGASLAPRPAPGDVQDDVHIGAFTRSDV